MNCCEAVGEILAKASRIRLSNHRSNVVTAARREFAKRGSCDARLIDLIERTMKKCLENWTDSQKRSIWQSTEPGAGEDLNDCELTTIDTDLAHELMYLILEELSPHDRRTDPGGDGGW